MLEAASAWGSLLIPCLSTTQRVSTSLIKHCSDPLMQAFQLDPAPCVFPVGLSLSRISAKSHGCWKTRAHLSMLTHIYLCVRALELFQALHSSPGYTSL
jgi:hypothetical protein